jgi:hypothetical protein
MPTILLTLLFNICVIQAKIRKTFVNKLLLKIICKFLKNQSLEVQTDPKTYVKVLSWKLLCVKFLYFFND